MNSSITARRAVARGRRLPSPRRDLLYTYQSSSEMLQKARPQKPARNRNGAMRRLTNRLLILLALALLALGAAAQLALIHTPVPPLVFIVGRRDTGVAAPDREASARRSPTDRIPGYAGLLGGADRRASPISSSSIKPVMVKGFITAAFAPKPTAVAAEAVKAEKWPPELTAIGTLRAYQGVLIAPQAAGMVTAKHFEFGRRRRSRRAAHQHRRFGRAGRPRQRPCAIEERRCDACASEDARRAGQYPAIDRRHGARDPRLGGGDR